MCFSILFIFTSRLNYSSYCRHFRMPKNPFIFNGLQLIISLMNIWTLEEAENMKFLWKHLVANSSKYCVGWYLLLGFNVYNIALFSMVRFARQIITYVECLELYYIICLILQLYISLSSLWIFCHVLLLSNT